MHFTVKKKTSDMVQKQQEQRQELRATLLHAKSTTANSQFVFLLLSWPCSGSGSEGGKNLILV